MGRAVPARGPQPPRGPVGVPPGTRLAPRLSGFCLAGEGGLQSLLGNMSHSQLMQLIGPAGLGGLGKPVSGAHGLRGWSLCDLKFSFCWLSVTSVNVCSRCRLPREGPTCPMV